MVEFKQDWQRAVIKVGSSLIAPNGNGCSTKYLLSLADFVHDCQQQDKQVILVSSGAVAAGAGVANVDLSEPQSIPAKQALAAIGQSKLMQHWQRLFDDTCAQILLTRSDLESPRKLENTQNMLAKLFSMKVLPIINENDSTVIEELVVGDNDSLAAHVAVMCEADLLIICSDVDGLYDKNPAVEDNAKLIPVVNEIDQKIIDCAGVTTNPIATGGMQTKLQAAQIASPKGVQTLIINGRKAESFAQLKRGQCPGTLFLAATAL